MRHLFNFRDLGGLQTNCGRQVRHGQLFRTGNLGHIQDSSAEFLVREKNVSIYIDFRADEEIKRFGRPQPLIDRKVDWVNLRIDTNDPVFTALLRPTPEDWAGLYIRLFEKNLNEWIRFLKVIKAAQHGVIYGCLFGKDRTGIATSLVLSQLNVRDDHIFEDYSRTTKEMAHPYFAQLRALFGESKISEEDVVKYFINTPGEIIASFLEFYRSRAANELRHVLAEIGETNRLELQQKLLESVSSEGL